MSSAGIPPEKEVDLVQDLLCALNLALTLAQAVGATTPIMLQAKCSPQVRVFTQAWVFVLQGR